MFKLVREARETPLRRVCVLGVGDAGSRAVEGVLGGMSGEGPLAVINTDGIALARSKAATKLQIGRRGGADASTGGDPALGGAAAERDLEMIRGLFSDCDALILAAGLGGGTGTGVSPVVLSAARASGLLTLAVVTTPFSFEGPGRGRIAQDGLQAVAGAADFTAVIPNDRLFAGAGAEGDVASAFARADEALAAGICSLWHMLAQPMLIGVDAGGFVALASKGSGVCSFGFGTAAGPGRAQAAARALVEGPVFEAGAALRSCGAALVCVCGSHDMTLQEVGDAVDAVSAVLPAGGDLQIGTVINEAWRDRVFVSAYLADNRRTVTPVTRDGHRAPDPAVSRKSSRSKGAQEELKFDGIAGRGRFNNMAATILDGEDLDTPTFIRHGIVLEK
jgi:cell division protein FtsZ